jgi:hypothetical protein
LLECIGRRQSEASRVFERGLEHLIIELGGTIDQRSGCRSARNAIYLSTIDLLQRSCAMNAYGVGREP